MREFGLIIFLLFLFVLLTTGLLKFILIGLIIYFGAPFVKVLYDDFVCRLKHHK